MNRLVAYRWGVLMYFLKRSKNPKADIVDADFLKIQEKRLNSRISEKLLEKNSKVKIEGVLIPNGYTAESVAWAISELIQHHLRLDDPKNLSEMTRAEVRRYFKLLASRASNLSQEEVADAILLYRELNTIQFPEVGIVTLSYLDKLDANPKDFKLNFIAGLILDQSFRAEFFVWAHQSSRSIFSEQTKTHLAHKISKRETKKMLDSIAQEFASENDLNSET